MNSLFSRMTRRLKRALSPFLSLRVKTSAYRTIDATKVARLAFARKRLPYKRYAARRLGLSRPPEGVNLVASIRAEMGQGTAARGIASALDAAQIPFGVIDLPYDIPSRHEDTTWMNKQTGDAKYDITIVSTTPDNFRNVKLRTPPKTLGDSYVIANWFWELPEIPESWMNAFKVIDEVWAPSRFIYDALSRRSPVPVVHIPPVVQLDHELPFSRDHFALPLKRFLFLGMFDTWSIIERKNPRAVLQAFQKAFPSPSPEAGLVLKFNNPEHQRSFLDQLSDEVAARDDIWIYDRVMAREEVNSLIAACDCVVSLHRSEGFGYVPAEAMSMGKPAILTNWSGNTDYMTGDNSIAIDYELVVLGRDYEPYEAHQKWAEPNVEQAAHWMRRLFEDRELALKIGGCARETIRREFSPTAVGELIKKRLSEIRNASL
jgi:glycosyltransferase involved in cell wall biosynthesis